ncbi:MAG: hypothetical protein ACE5FI_02195 [Anaerolineales bacterium]
MAVSIATTLEASARRLFPDMSIDQILAELLLERAQKNLIKYRALNRKFNEKYGQSFERFRQEILNSEPGSEQEQNYFDWELAVTGIADMEAEIERLGGLVQRA